MDMTSRYARLVRKAEGDWKRNKPFGQKCKFCGSTDVEWVTGGVRWQLFNSAMTERHSCVGSPNDFEDISGNSNS